MSHVGFTFILQLYTLYNGGRLFSEQLLLVEIFSMRQTFALLIILIAQFCEAFGASGPLLKVQIFDRFDRPTSLIDAGARFILNCSCRNQPDVKIQINGPDTKALVSVRGVAFAIFAGKIGSDTSPLGTYACFCDDVSVTYRISYQLCSADEQLVMLRTCRTDLSTRTFKVCARTSTSGRGATLCDPLTAHHCDESHQYQTENNQPRGFCAVKKREFFNTFCHLIAAYELRGADVLPNLVEVKKMETCRDGVLNEYEIFLASNDGAALTCGPDLDRNIWTMVNEFHPFKASSTFLHVCFSHKTADSLAIEYFIDSIEGLNSPKNLRYESPKIAAFKIYDRNSMGPEYFYQKFSVEQKSMHSGLIVVTVKNTKSKYAGRYSFLVPYQFLSAKFDKNDIEIRQGQSCPAVAYLYCQFKRPYTSDFFVRSKWEHKNLTSLDSSTNLVNEFGSTSILIAGDEGIYKCIAEIYIFHTNMKNATFYTVPYAFDLTNECLTAKGTIVRYGLGSAYTASGKKPADVIFGYVIFGFLLLFLLLVSVVGSIILCVKYGIC